MPFNRNQRIALYAVAFLIPPALVATITITSNVSNTMLRKQPDPVSAPTPASPVLDSHLPIALIVLSNVGTQLRETLSAAQAIGRSGKYQVVTAAPERTLSPTTGELAILPDFSFADAPTPSLLVLPSVLDPQMPKMNEYVSHIVPVAKQVLALGEGVRLLIPGGFLRGKRATSHFLSLDELRSSTPGTTWVQSEVIRDGNLVTSSGVAATGDAVHEVLGEPYTPAAPSLSAPLSALFFHAAFDWDKPKVAVALANGVDEEALGQALDLYPRTFSYKIVSASPERNWVKTSHGLTVVASSTFNQLSQLDEIILPTGTSPQLTHDWIVRTAAEVVPLTANSNETDQEILDRIALHRPEVARASAFLIGSHWRPLKPSGAFDNWLWLRPFFLGVLGLLLMRLFLRPRTN